MEEKVIPIKWQGKDAEVTIKRLNFGDRNKLIEQCRETTFIGGVQKVNVLEGRLRVMSLRLGIKQAPFSLDEATINAMDGALGEKLYVEIDKFNTLDPGKAGDPAGPGSQTAETRKRDQVRPDNPEGPAEEPGVLPTG